MYIQFTYVYLSKLKHSIKSTTIEILLISNRNLIFNVLLKSGLLKQKFTLAPKVVNVPGIKTDINCVVKIYNKFTHNIVFQNLGR